MWLVDGIAILAIATTKASRSLGQLSKQRLWLDTEKLQAVYTVLNDCINRYP